MKSKSLLDPTFKYTSSVNTDLKRTFARVRREQKQQAEITKLPPNVKIVMMDDWWYTYLGLGDTPVNEKPHKLLPEEVQMKLPPNGKIVMMKKK